MTGVPIDPSDIDLKNVTPATPKRRSNLIIKPNEDWVELPATQPEVLHLQFMRTTQGTEYKGWWEKLSPENAKAVVKVVTAVPEEMAQRTEKGFPEFGTNFVGSTGTAMPLYLYEETPEAVLRSEGKLTYLATHWLVALKQPDPIAPFLISFYWSTRFEKWVPLEFTRGSLDNLESKISPCW
jgi:hypothetical protein